MPARTLSPFVATDRALSSPPARHPHPHQDNQDVRRGTYVAMHRDLFTHHVLYDTSRHVQGIEYSAHFAPPMERTNYPLHVFPPAPLPVQPTSPLPPGWAPHPPPLSRLPPPPLLHKVWILDCKSCGTFLTNRGMKAVLLLRPNVPLYSTDALPINCSAHRNMLDSNVSVKAEPSSPLSASLTSPTANNPGRAQSSRTCECLTQTLYCHGCGKGVGYMIVIPCHRCTSSMTVTNRMTNGHRFVFYSCEIMPSERHYVSGEAGVMEHDIPPVPSPLPHAMGIQIPILPTVYPQPLPGQPPSPSTPRRATLRGRRGVHVHTHTRTPSSPRSRRSTLSSDPGSPPPLMPLSPHSPPVPAADGSYGRDRDAAPPLEQEGPLYARIREGDVLFWHNLVRSGEIPAVREDARARGVVKEEERGGAVHKREADAPEVKPRRKIAAGR